MRLGLTIRTSPIQSQRVLSTFHFFYNRRLRWNHRPRTAASSPLPPGWASIGPTGSTIFAHPGGKDGLLGQAMPAGLELLLPAHRQRAAHHQQDTACAAKELWVHRDFPDSLTRHHRRAMLTHSTTPTRVEPPSFRRSEVAGSLVPGQEGTGALRFWGRRPQGATLQ